MLGWMIFGEHVNLTQMLGLALTLTGGLAVSLLKEKPHPPPQAAVTPATDDSGVPEA